MLLAYWRKLLVRGVSRSCGALTILTFLYGLISSQKRCTVPRYSQVGIWQNQVIEKAMTKKAMRGFLCIQFRLAKSKKPFLYDYRSMTLWLANVRKATKLTARLLVSSVA